MYMYTKEKISLKSQVLFPSLFLSFPVCVCVCVCLCLCLSPLFLSACVHLI